MVLQSKEESACNSLRGACSVFESKFRMLFSLLTCFVFSVPPYIFLPVISRKDLPVLLLAERYNESWNDLMCPPQTSTLRTLSVTRDGANPRCCIQHTPTPLLLPQVNHQWLWVSFFPGLMSLQLTRSSFCWALI